MDQSFCTLCGNTFFTAQKVDAPSALSCFVGQLIDHFASGNAFGKLRRFQPAAPNDGLTIGDDQVGLLRDRSHRRIIGVQHHVIQIRRDRVAGCSPRDQLSDSLNGFGKRDDVEGHVPNIDLMATEAWRR